MSDYERIAISEPVPGVQVVTLNRPEKRNAIDNTMRAELLQALQRADGDPAVRVSIVRGAGTCFSSGYDLKSDLGANQPYFTPNVGLQWARHVSEGWMSLWDLAKPVIAMIHGYAMAGGLELAGACDLAYAAPPRGSRTPCCASRACPTSVVPALLSARHAMELHVAGREYNGVEAASAGLVNQAFPDDELETRVFEIAKRIAEVPPAVVTVNKRFVYAALEARGARNVIRVGNDLQAGPHLASIGGDTSGLMQQIKATRKP
jgi:enoyl-CoA hydratase